jgi:hypothetical protein
MLGSSATRAKKDQTTPASLQACLNLFEATGVSLHQILAHAEREGMAISDMVRWTDGFLNRIALLDAPDEAEVLVFSAVRQWRALYPAVSKRTMPLVKALLINEPGHFECPSRLPEHHFVPRFKERVLGRLGYPKVLSKSPRADVKAKKNLEEVMDWLGSGRSVIGYDLKFQGFEATSPSWGTLWAGNLWLKDGTSPASIQWRSDPMDPTCWRLLPTLRIEGLKGLRNISGMIYEKVTITDCPDLESLDGPCKELQIVGCPKVSCVAIGPRTNYISLKQCEGLRSIAYLVEDHPNVIHHDETWANSLEELEVLDCGSLRMLPPRLIVRGRMLLQRVGPIESWPWDFQVGDTLLISDCPDIESLPALAVQGSLVVTGESGLRRLSPGTVIGKHLDLRACTQLEDVPRGVRVGGTMFLPEHLNHRRENHFPFIEAESVLVEAPEPDLYEDLLVVLKAMRFRDLIHPLKRSQAMDQAEAILCTLNARLEVEPKLESLLLWTASEVWRDLSEEDWAKRNPWDGDGNATDEDLPMAWFLGILGQ